MGNLPSLRPCGGGTGLVGKAIQKALMGQGGGGGGFVGFRV